MAITELEHLGSHAAEQPWTSRAVARRIEPGCHVYCALCETQIKFSARAKADQIICNIYAGNVWQRVEHYHEECYEAAGAPYGDLSR